MCKVEHLNAYKYVLYCLGFIVCMDLWVFKSYIPLKHLFNIIYVYIKSLGAIVVWMHNNKYSSYLRADDK